MVTRSQRRVGRRERLAALSRRPVIAAVLGAAALDPFVESKSMACILAQFDLIDLEHHIQRVREKSNKLVFVNLDSTFGLAQDRGGVEFLERLGADGIVTTRGSLVSQATQAGLLAVQKMFVTDRSNLNRAVTAVQSAKPDLLQIMPSPVLPYVSDHEIMTLRPVIAGGFIQSEDDIRRALKHRAVGVSVSSPDLWDYENPVT